MSLRQFWGVWGFGLRIIKPLEPYKLLNPDPCRGAKALSPSSSPLNAQVSLNLGLLGHGFWAHSFIWVVVKIMVPFWIPIIIRHLIFWVHQE